jgi:hypothetical protein
MRLWFDPWGNFGDNQRVILVKNIDTREGFFVFLASCGAINFGRDPVRFCIPETRPNSEKSEACKGLGGNI